MFHSIFHSAFHNNFVVSPFHVFPNYVTIVITADFLPFGVGSGDMIGSQEVDAADDISVDSPVVFFLQNYSNIFVSL